MHGELINRVEYTDVIYGQWFLRFSLIHCNYCGEIINMYDDIMVPLLLTQVLRCGVFFFIYIAIIGNVLQYTQKQYTIWQ